MSFEDYGKFGACAGYEALQRSQRNTEYLRRLAMRPSLAKAEQDGGAFPLGKACERTIYIDADVRAGNTGIFGEFHDTLTPAIGKELGPGNAQQPALIATISAIRRSRAPRLNKTGLGKVFGEHIAAEPPQEAAHTSFVKAHECAESGGVPRRGVTR